MSLTEVRLCVAAVTWTGCGRAQNEDAASVNGSRVGALSGGAHIRPRHLLLVADGMGGHVGGATASDIAVRFLEAEEACLTDARTSVGLVRGANRAVYGAAGHNPALRGLGTTIAGASVTVDEVVWFNAGDSRIYLAGSSGLRQLSVDHAIGFALTQCLGGSAHLQDVSPASGAERWGPGDRILLCSDGLTNLVRDVEIAELLGAETENAKVAACLLRLASARGAPDNVTVVLATNHGSR